MVLNLIIYSCYKTAINKRESMFYFSQLWQYKFKKCSFSMGRNWPFNNRVGDWVQNLLDMIMHPSTKYSSKEAQESLITPFE